MTTLSKPGLRPANPNFSSGPCAKRPGWSLQALENAAARPGLSLLATDDPYIGSDEIRRRAANRAGDAHVGYELHIQHALIDDDGTD